MILLHLGPVFRQNASGKWVNLAEGRSFKAACPIKAKAEAPRSAEKVQDAQFRKSPRRLCDGRGSGRGYGRNTRLGK
jgi:hypothetical protein